MPLIYNLSVFFYRLVIRIAAITGNAKAKLWLCGRKNIFRHIQAALQPGERRIWFHCASLGEFEQGRPLLEKFRSQDSTLPGVRAAHKIVLTFFSPSGYEVRKNYPGADYIFYLPIDTRSNAGKFISLINPEKVFFIKYEYWFYYFDELRRRNIPNYLVSAIFRPGQRFFKWYGGFFRKMLQSVSHFFVQDDESAALLNSIGLKNCTVTGDTRFDRVINTAATAMSLPIVEKFKNGNQLLIAGSTWEKDEQLLLATFSGLSRKNRDVRIPGFKLILAPHEVNERRISGLMNTLSGFKVTRFSEANETTIASFEILIIDNIGMLSSLYRYGSFGYIGGGFGRGIHNILEAAVFGIPVLFGPNYQKFREATDLVSLGGAFSVTTSDELNSAIENLLKDEKKYHDVSLTVKNYVYHRKGATEKILSSVMEK